MNQSFLLILQQVVSAISQISFGSEESVLPKKPTTLTEVAKQRELSGTLEGETDAEIKKQISEAKSKELNGHNIFSPPPEIPVRPLAPRNLDLRGHLDFALHQSKNIYTSAEVSNVSEIVLMLAFYALILTRASSQKYFHFLKFVISQQHLCNFSLLCNL